MLKRAQEILVIRILSILSEKKIESTLSSFKFTVERINLQKIKLYFSKLDLMQIP